MYWYYGPKSDASMLISYILGSVTPQTRNGIQEGVYNIDSEFNFVIENVTTFNEGTYTFEVKPKSDVMHEGQVEVLEKVSPNRPYPTVIGCNEDHDADTCEATVWYDTTVHNLTCVMEQVKPAVELKWFLGGLTELKAYLTVRPVAITAYSGSSLRNNTYSTSVSIQVPSVDSDVEYVCEAKGVAVGSTGSTRTRVRLANIRPTTATNNEVQSSTNSGSTLALANEASPTANRPFEKCDAVIMLGVACSIIVFIACVVIGYLLKKLKKLKKYKRKWKGMEQVPLQERGNRVN
ncbi:uncharacterized protein LOC119723578 isoform X2 [Patiria miniata]|nr:uncharacterized protein LOC119723578 isoform X2 [Patiria miniata]